MRKSWSQGFDRVESDRKTKTSSNRNFGFLVGGAFVIIGLLSNQSKFSALPLTLGALLIVLALVRPSLLEQPKRLWFKLAGLLHHIINPIIMFILFFVILTPLAVVLRLLGRDPLDLKKNVSHASYWKSREVGPENQNDKFKFQF